MCDAEPLEACHLYLDNHHRHTTYLITEHTLPRCCIFKGQLSSRGILVRSVLFQTAYPARLKVAKFARERVSLCCVQNAFLRLPLPSESF